MFGKNNFAQKYINKSSVQFLTIALSLLLIPVTFVLVQKQISLRTKGVGENYTSFEAESATLQGGTTIGSDTTASNSRYIMFGNSTISNTNSPTNRITATVTPQQPISGFSSGISDSQGIWISKSEINALPTTGTAWNNVVAWAGKSIASISINNQDSESDQIALAKALICSRINEHCSEIISALNTLASNPPNGDRALAWGRNLSSWVIAADIVKNSGNSVDFDISKFKTWTYDAIRTSSTEGGTIIACHERYPNNWSTMCGGSRIAADLLDGDTTDLNRAWDEYRGYVGDRSSGALTGNSVVTTNWRCPGDSDRTWINPKGCSKFSHNFDGMLPQEMLRQGEYDGITWPPTLGTDYPFNGMAGLMLQAELLARHGFSSFTVGDNAMLRAYSWAIDVAGWSVTQASHTTWMPYIVNKRYGKSYPVPLPALPGQNIGFVDWTHK